MNLDIPHTPAIGEDARVFDFHNYKEIHSPHALEHVTLEVLNQEYPRCLDMPIRMPNSDRYHLPTEWVGLLPLIEQITATEHAHNLNWKDYYTYITVDCKEVELSEQQRHGGLHVDGFQGARISPKTKITRNYVMTTNGGTRFYPQPFIVVDETKYNVFQGFDLQAKDIFFTAKENVAYFMDAYTVHESGLAERAGMRTFLRVTYDLKKFDRSGNTHNSMLNYDWDMIERKVHGEVVTPAVNDVANSPYA